MRWALAIIAAVTLASPVAAVSPYDLFFRSESDSMLLGGGDLPGDISGRPELERPTSLLHAQRPIVRIDLCSQTPLELSDDHGNTLGRWESDALKLTLVQPLSARWSLGVEAETVDDVISYDNDDDGYRIDASSDAWSLGVACRVDDRWAAAAAYGFGGLKARGRGSAVADLLDLAPGDERWPALDTDDRSFTVAARYESDRWQAGASRGWSDPTATVRVARDVYSYTAPVDQGADWYEIWGAWRDGEQQWWAGLRDLRSDGGGTIFLGAGGRGDVSVDLSDRTISLGWRHETAEATTLAQFDWRDAEFATYDQGYAGLLPGISADVYTLRANAGGRTGSLRVGHRRRFSEEWSWAVAGGAHVAEIDHDLILRRASGIGRSPITEYDSHLDDGELRLWSLTLGLVHETRDFRAVLTGTAGFAETNRSFEDALEEQGPDGEGGSLDVRPLVTLGAEWRL